MMKLIVALVLLAAPLLAGAEQFLFAPTLSRKDSTVDLGPMIAVVN